jgi:hypothetical protein
MLKKEKRLGVRPSVLGLLILVCSSFGPSIAVAVPMIVVDGNLDDWKVTIGDNTDTDFSDLDPDIISPFIEDTDDSSNSYAVDPNYGGQNYDVEFLGSFINNNILYIGILSGQRPDNGEEFYAPGDIYINLGGVNYGIEVGGGAGGVNGSLIEENAAGTTYTLDNSGYTTGSTDDSYTQTAGSVWENPGWMLDPIYQGNPPGNLKTQINDLSSSTYIGIADYVFTRDSDTSTHSVIELAWDISSLGLSGPTDLSVQWAPSCGNDVAHTNGSYSVPEPNTLALLSAGFLGILGIPFLRRRKTNRNQIDPKGTYLTAPRWS